MSSWGTRGDIQPFIALGKALINAGHEVHLCAPSSYEDWITAHGLDYHYMNNEFIELVHSEAGRRIMDQASNFIGTAKLFLEMSKKIKPLQKQVMDECYEAAVRTQPDLLLVHPKTIGQFFVAEKMNIRAAAVWPMPAAIPTREFPQMFLTTKDLGGPLNRFSYTLTLQILTGLAQGYVTEWARARLGMKRPPRFTNLFLRPINGRPTVQFHAYSSHLVPDPPDWPSHLYRTTGYWFLDESMDYSPPQDLQKFLSNGPPPIYAGFGSMAGRRGKEIACALVEAVEKVGCRALLSTGWGGLEISDSHPLIHILEGAPHHWLFPKMAAAIHHGGAGTTASSLRAGLPTLICPFLGDQPFWGRKVAQSGAGPSPIKQKKITAHRLAAAIDQMLHDQTMREKARALGEKIRAEKGTENAVREIEKLLAAN